MTKQNRDRKTSGIKTPGFLYVGGLSLDLHQQKAKLDGKMIALPPCTYEYLLTLMRNFPHPVSYHDLVWESQGFHLSRLEAQDLARCRIHVLRKVLEPEPQTPQYILAVAGFGYRLVA
jgi:DNA-binding response OmpR family regulator